MVQWCCNLREFLGRRANVCPRPRKNTDSLRTRANRGALLTSKLREVKDRMPYMRSLLYETLRLHPVVPVIYLVAAEDDVLPSGAPVAAGTGLRLFVYGMGRDERLYADPLAFRPERWAETPVPNPWEFPQLPQPSDQVWTVLKAGETVHQEGELPKTN